MSLFKGLKPIVYGGREVWPLVEGGKGVAVSNHASSGAWAAAGGIGTVSAVNADSFVSLRLSPRGLRVGFPLLEPPPPARSWSAPAWARPIAPTGPSAPHFQRPLIHL